MYIQTDIFLQVVIVFNPQNSFTHYILEYAQGMKIFQIFV